MKKATMAGSVSLGMLLGCIPGARGNSVTASQTLSANLGAQAKLAVVQASITFIRAGATFTNYTGAVTVQYRVRTTPSGSGSLVVKAMSDFSPANGPSIANSDLTYTCSGATVGSACSGTQTVQTASTTNVVTVGGGLCTGSGCAGTDPDSVSISLTLADKPTFKTGTYSTSLLFSISAL
jgi:hypothetical protein